MFVFVKRFIAVFAAICTVVGAPRVAMADEIVNVEYIVGFVKNKWGVDVPYVPAEIHWAANVEYLLKVVDYVNGKLNNGEKTNYGESEYATKEVVDTIAANQAIRTLIKKKGPEYKFFFTPAESNGNKFKFWIGAKGTFYIDWDDGTTKTIEKTELGLQEIAHEYADAAANHTIKLGGMATEYAPMASIYDGNIVSYSAIGFLVKQDGGNLASIDGCLGCVFPTLANGAQPMFVGTFTSQQELKTLPETLFDNIHGAGYPVMFYMTFAFSGLETVPTDLFAGITDGAYWMFFGTFANCSNLTTAPSFRNIKTGGEGMFESTFSQNAFTSVPDDMFAGLTVVAPQMFVYTFDTCVNLKRLGDNWFPNLEIIESADTFEGVFIDSGVEEIGDNWFPKLTSVPEGGVDYSAFAGLFDGLGGLKKVGANWFAGLNTIEKDYAFSAMFYNHKYLETIGDGWFANLDGATGRGVFSRMFYRTSSLKSMPSMFKTIKTGGEYLFDYTFFEGGLTSIPEDMFGGLTQIKEGMFQRTFSNCSDLTEIPEHLFDGIIPDWSYKTDMFNRTFYNCTSLTGPSARINGQYLYDIWPNAYNQGTYYNDTGLDDYDAIPSDWKVGGW